VRNLDAVLLAAHTAGLGGCATDRGRQRRRAPASARALPRIFARAGESGASTAAHLDPAGCFVVELQIPQLRRIPPGESTHPFRVTDEHLGFDTYEFAEQRLTSHHYWLAGDHAHRFDSHHRYAWPAELDLMAEPAGMRLRERWADWARSPLTGESHDHVFGVGEGLSRKRNTRCSSTAHRQIFRSALDR
jgi:hypothetical protein